MSDVQRFFFAQPSHIYCMGATLSQATTPMSRQTWKRAATRSTPLDAFMAENDGAAAAAISSAQQAAAATQPADMDVDDVDPLDAFMAAEVLPAVKQEPGQHVAPGTSGPPIALPKVEAPPTVPVGVKAEAANGTAGVAADGVAPPDKLAIVKRRARRRYADSDDSSDDEPESASEDDEVCSAQPLCQRHCRIMATDSHIITARAIAHNVLIGVANHYPIVGLIAA